MLLEFPFRMRLWVRLWMHRLLLLGLLVRCGVLLLHLKWMGLHVILLANHDLLLVCKYIRLPQNLFSSGHVQVEIPHLLNNLLRDVLLIRSVLLLAL